MKQQVAVKKEHLRSYQSDTWFPLVPVAPDTEVQGRIHLGINQYEYICTSDENGLVDTPRLSVR